MRSRSLRCCSQARSPLCLHQLLRLLRRLSPLHLLLRLLGPLPLPLCRLSQVSSLRNVSFLKPSCPSKENMLKAHWQYLYSMLCYSARRRSGRRGVRKCN